MNAKRALTIAGSTWVLGILIGLCAWTAVPLRPSATIDASWMVGLQMALNQGLHFGPDVIFTYGPLGFLQTPMVAFGPFSQLAAIYLLLVNVGLGLTLVWVTRRAFGVWVAIPLSLLVTLLLTLAPVVAIVVIWSLVALGPESPPRLRSLYPYAAGVLAAVEVLDKLSIGPVILVICGLTVLCFEGPWRRNLLAFLGSFVLTFLVLWFGTGQALTALPQFVHSGWQVVSGYSSGMPASAPENNESIRIIGLAAMVVASLLAGYVATRQLPRRRQMGVAGVILLASFGVWKMAFVRFGPPTMPYVFVATLPAFLAFPWRRISLPAFPCQVPVAALPLAAVVAIAIGYFPFTTLPVSQLDPIKRIDLEFEQLPDLVVPSRGDRLKETAHEEITADFPLDRRTLAELHGHTVDVDQSDISVAWAYGLDWRPLPVLQAYAAYTPYLDRQDADALLGSDAPERILRISTASPLQMLETNPSEVQSYNWFSDAESGFRAWNQPRTTLAMLCNFEALSTTKGFQVLQRGPDRCGAPKEIGSVEAGWGEEIAVPAVGDKQRLIYADVEGLAPSGGEKIRTLLFRAKIVTAVFDNALQFTVQPELDQDLLLEASPGANLPEPFGLTPNPKMIRFEKQGGGSGKLTVRFYELPVRGASR
jgi:hypothetical protein